jgi:hypothetical protein
MQGDYDAREEREVYANIIIDFRDYFQELTNNPSDLSKSLKFLNETNQLKLLIFIVSYGNVDVIVLTMTGHTTVR